MVPCHTQPMIATNPVLIMTRAGCGSKQSADHAPSMPLPKNALFSPREKVEWAAVEFDHSHAQSMGIDPPWQLDGVRGMGGSGWSRRSLETKDLAVAAGHRGKVAGPHLNGSSQALPHPALSSDQTRKREGWISTGLRKELALVRSLVATMSRHPRQRRLTNVGDGCGFDPAVSHKWLGLRVMQDQVSRAGRVSNIVFRLDSGSSIQIHFPHLFS